MSRLGAMAEPDGGSGIALVRRGVVRRLRTVLARRGHDNPLAPAMAVALLTWLPAALLSLIEVAKGSPAGLAFFTDLSTYARSWVAIPLLVIADAVVDLHVIDADGRIRELLAPEGVARLDAMDRTVDRLANLRMVEVVAGILAFLPVILRFTGTVREGGENWILQGGGNVPTTGAGWWYALVGIPLFPFLLLLWVWRYAVWIRFLFKVSRLPLRLMPSHPDRAGGLGFMEMVQGSFYPVVGGVSVMLAGAWAESIQQKTATPQTYGLPFLVFLVSVVLVFIFPTMVFAWQLSKLRVQGQRGFDFLTSRYNRDFESRWVRPPAPDSPLGSSDIQSFNDMTGSFNTSHQMRVFIVGVQGALPVLVAAVAPMLLPLGVSVPLSEIARESSITWCESPAPRIRVRGSPAPLPRT